MVMPGGQDHHVFWAGGVAGAKTLPPLRQPDRIRVSDSGAGRLRRVLKWGCLTTIVGLVLVVVLAVMQIRAYRDALRAPEPLALPAASVTSQRTREVLEPIRTQLLRPRAAAGVPVPSPDASERAIELDAATLKYLAVLWVRHPGNRLLMQRASAELAGVTASLPGFVGDFSDLHVDRLDVDQLRLDIELGDDTLTLRATAPYRDDDGHLNLSGRATGHWSMGDAELRIESLMVGGQPLVEMPILGIPLEDGIKIRHQGSDAEPLFSDVRVRNGKLRLVPRPGAEAAIAREIAALQ